MFIGKKNPMNIRELLLGLVDEIVDYDGPTFFPGSLAIKSYFAKHRVSNLIKPVLISSVRIFAVWLYIRRRIRRIYFL